MQFTPTNLFAVQTPEGTAQIEVRAAIVEIHGRRPTRHPWLFAILKLLTARVAVACECVPATAELLFTVRQGEVIFQTFPKVRLAQGDGRGITLDVPITCSPPDLERRERMFYRGIWASTLMLPLDRQPMPPVVL